MATFQYQALTTEGRLMAGTIEAADRDQAADQLGRMNLQVNSLDAAAREKPRTPVGRNEFLLFNQQLAALTRAGIPLERGLRELAHDIASGAMRRLVVAIADDLEAGVGIEEAFAKHQRSFPPLYGRILKAGVETGRLSEMLTSLNRHLEMSGQTRRIIFEAFTYPAVVFTMASLIVTGILLYIVPQFREVLEEMVGGHLPGLTLGLFAMASNVVAFWGIVGVVVGVVVLTWLGLSATPGGRRFQESVIVRIPLIGRVYHSSVLARMAEAMSMMVAAGCDMPACLRLGAGASGSERAVLEAEMVASQVEQGVGILEAGQFSHMVPRLFFYSMQLGAQRNELQDNLHSLSRMYADHTRCIQARLETVALPIMIIFLGGFVAMMVMALFLPMVQVITSLSAAS